jgi:hypothetical protein
MVNVLKTIPGNVNNECYTPKWIFDELGLEFDLDVASPPPPINTHVPAKHFFTINEDGLTQEWTGRVWMNPPFSKPLPWVERFMSHANGIALLPTSTGKWQLQLWKDCRAGWVMLPPMRFDGYKNVLPTRCFLIGYGEECINALRNIGQVKGAI